MSSTSPIRKKQSKNKKLVGNNSTGKANGSSELNHTSVNDKKNRIFDEIHRVIDGRESPKHSKFRSGQTPSPPLSPTAIHRHHHRSGMTLDETIFSDGYDAKHHSVTITATGTAPVDKDLVDKYVKDINLEFGSGRCLVCHQKHQPDNGPSDSNDSHQLFNYPQLFCSDCKKIIEKDRDANCSVTLKVTATNGDQSTTSTTTLISSSASIATQTSNTGMSSMTSVSSSSCSCQICKKLEHEELKSLWLELKMCVLRIYRDSDLLLSQMFILQNRLDWSSHSKQPMPTNERLKEIVHRLCVHDRHKLYQCLEAQVRLFVLEMRLNLLRNLEQGSQALFESMIDQYSRLCKSSKKTAHFLQELETKHLRKFNLTWEFLNRRLFQSTVYCDPFIKHGLPKLTALTKDRSLIDMYARFLKFEDEMTVISVVWREAQQFIDKYEKYTALSKKKTLLKEWEQLSVEFVLDDHQTSKATSKQNGEVSPSSSTSYCIKKPSIECLNARFLEEQKMLKSSRNMQAVDLATETKETLRDQLLLAACGEWDSSDSSLRSSLSSKSSKAMYSNVDFLLNSKSKCETLSDNDEDEEDDDEEEEEEGDDVGEDEYDEEGDDEDDEDEDDDTEEEDDDDDEDDDALCSDQSSSTSNNARGDGGRVCDCCYCEVFGHGMPAMAPTSRNYAEIRERLRMRLSKRKAEKCENGNMPSSPNGCANAGNSNGNSVRKKESVDKEDKRDLEELLNYINGTDSNGKGDQKGKKKEKQKKKKEKQKEKRTSDTTVDANDMTITASDIHVTPREEIDRNVRLKCVEAKHRNNKENSQPNECNPVTIDAENSCSNISINNAKNGTANATTGVNSQNNNNKKGKQHGEKKDDVPNGHIPCQPRHVPTIENENSRRLQRYQNHKAALHKHGHNDESPSHHHQKLVSQTALSNAVVCNGIDKTNGVNKLHSKQSPKCQQVANQNQHYVKLSERNSDANWHVKGKQRHNKKRNCIDDGPPPDDVFMPKDIDLDNGELDEVEKELEEFKRFCYNSVPLPRKEKVSVNLKDIVIKRRPNVSTE